MGKQSPAQGSSPCGCRDGVQSHTPAQTGHHCKVSLWTAGWTSCLASRCSSYWVLQRAGQGLGDFLVQLFIPVTGASNFESCVACDPLVCLHSRSSPNLRLAQGSSSPLAPVVTHLSSITQTWVPQWHSSSLLRRRARIGKSC